MIKNAIHDIKTTLGVFKDLRKARKEGGEIVVVQKRQIPIIVSGGFYNTVEGCALSWLDSKIVDLACEAFNGLPDDEKHRMQFSPKDGDFIERAILWKDIFKPVMTQNQRHIAMNCIIEWYIHIKKMRFEKGGVA